MAAKFANCVITVFNYNSLRLGFQPHLFRVSVSRCKPLSSNSSSTP